TGGVGAGSPAAGTAGSAGVSAAGGVTVCDATRLFAVTATTRRSRAIADADPADIRAATALMIGTVPVTWPPAARTIARPSASVVPGRSRTIWVAGREPASADPATDSAPTTASRPTRMGTRTRA